MDFDENFSFGKIRISRYDKYSNRPTIVFLHDSLGCIELWRQFPLSLGELTKCNVFIYDRIGYGKSSALSSFKRTKKYLEIEADNLNEILEKYNIEKAILFGHSDGGSISLIAGAKYPSRILGIITVGAHIFVEDETINGVKEAIEKYRNTDLKLKLERYHGQNTEKMFLAWVTIWTSSEFRNWSIEPFLSKINCPSLIIQGENDEFGTIKQVEGITKQTAGNSSKLILPNLKHTPYKENPELVLEKVAEFIFQLLAEAQ